MTSRIPTGTPPSERPDRKRDEANGEPSFELAMCDVHGRVPGCIVCRHLMEGTAKEWRPVLPRPGVPEDEELQTDWICPECGDKFPDVPTDDLCLACVFCARELRGNDPAPMVNLFDWLEQHGVDVPEEHREDVAAEFAEIARERGYEPPAGGTT
jgi:hypothetical protein